MDKKALKNMVETLKKQGYTITAKQTEPDVDVMVKALQENGFDVVKAKTKTETETETETENETKTETKDTRENIVKFVLGTPTETNDGGDLTEEKIQVMTPEEIQKNIPEIREYILANGGKF